METFSFLSKTDTKRTHTHTETKSIPKSVKMRVSRVPRKLNDYTLGCIVQDIVSWVKHRFLYSVNRVLTP